MIAQEDSQQPAQQVARSWRSRLWIKVHNISWRCRQSAILTAQEDSQQPVQQVVRSSRSRLWIKVYNISCNKSGNRARLCQNPVLACIVCMSPSTSIASSLSL